MTKAGHYIPPSLAGIYYYNYWRESYKVQAVYKENFDEVYPLFEQLWPNKVLNKVELKRVFDRGVESKTDELFCAKINGNRSQVQC